MDLFGRGESLGTLNTVVFGDDDLETGTVRFGTHFALDGLGAAFEKIEHGGNYRTTPGEYPHAVDRSGALLSDRPAASGPSTAI